MAERPPAFLAMMVEPEVEAASSAAAASPRKRSAGREGRVEIDLAPGDWLGLTGEVDGRTLRETIAALSAR